MRLQILAWPGFSNVHTNPYNSLLYRELEKLQCDIYEYRAQAILGRKFDIWHLHWPELIVNHPSFSKALVKGIAFCALLTLAKLRGVRIVWTVHNLESHDKNHCYLERRIAAVFRWFVDGYISMSRSAEQQAQLRYPELKSKPHCVIPHGHYRGIYPDSVSRTDARLALGLLKDDLVLLFFGQVRRYKNLLKLIKVFRQLSLPRIRLVIAGATPDQAYKREIEEAVHGDDRIVCRLELIELHAVQHYLRSADLVVLPYCGILNSGAALLALSFGIPILVPGGGSLVELRSRFGPRWVSIYDDDLTATVLGDAVELAQRGDDRNLAELKDRLNDFSWPSVAKRTLHFYQSLLQR